MFHAKKPDAIKLAEKVGADSRVESVQVQFEPHNGWVVRVVPKRIHLPEYESVVELADGRDRPAPEKVRPKQPAGVADPSQPLAHRFSVPAQLISTGDHSKIPASGICHEILAFFGKEPRSPEEAVSAIREVFTPKRKSELWEKDPDAYLMDWVSWLYKKGALADGG
jgi:hypothetical protein